MLLLYNSNFLNQTKQCTDAGYNSSSACAKRRRMTLLSVIPKHLRTVLEPHKYPRAKLQVLLTLTFNYVVIEFVST